MTSTTRRRATESNLVNRAGKTRHDRFQTKHWKCSRSRSESIVEAGDDERAVVDAIDGLDLPTDRRAEHYEVQGRRHAPATECFASTSGTRAPSRSDRSRESRWTFTTSGSMHESDEDVLERDSFECKSLKSMPSSLELLERSGAMPVSRFARRTSTSAPWPLVRQLQAAIGERRQGSDVERLLKLTSISWRFTEPFASGSAFSSTTMSSPLLMTPMRSAISSASSM